MMATKQEATLLKQNKCNIPNKNQIKGPLTQPLLLREDDDTNEPAVISVSESLMTTDKEQHLHDYANSSAAEKSLRLDSKTKRTIRCLRVFLFCTLILNVCLAGGIVGIFMVFGSSDTPIIPPSPSPPPSGGGNLSCTINHTTSGGTSAVVKVASNDSSSINFCWYFPQFYYSGVEENHRKLTSFNSTKIENKDVISNQDLIQYSVYMDHWYENLTSPTIGILQNSSSVSTVSISNLLPGIPHQVQIHAQPLKASGEGQIVKSDIAVIWTSEKGGCGNIQDMSIYRASRKDTSNLKAVIKKCLMKGILDQNNTYKCIMHDTGLSYSCSQCWVPELNCILSRYAFCLLFACALLFLLWILVAGLSLRIKV